MSLPRVVGFSTVGGALAGAVLYLVMSPASPVLAVPSKDHVVVPTPTVTQFADCVSPAVLEAGECVTHVPGRIVVVANEPREASRPSDSPRPTPTVPTPRSTESPEHLTEAAEPNEGLIAHPTPTAESSEHDSEHDSEHEGEHDSEHSQSAEPTETHSESPEPSQTHH